MTILRVDPNGRMGRTVDRGTQVYSEEQVDEAFPDIHRGLNSIDP